MNAFQDIFICKLIIPTTLTLTLILIQTPSEAHGQPFDMDYVLPGSLRSNLTQSTCGGGNMAILKVANLMKLLFIL